MASYDSSHVTDEDFRSIRDTVSITSIERLQEASSNEPISQRTIQLADFLERTAHQLRSRVKRYDVTPGNDITRKRQKKRIPPKVAENIFIITCVLQLLCVAALELIDTLAVRFMHKQQIWYITGIVIGVVFQLSNLFLSLAVTVKLTKQYMHHNASMKFLLQSYLSTLFLFGGIYTLIAREWPETFEKIRGNRHGNFFAMQLYGQLLFTSISTGTLCGAATVVAIHWITEALMAFQMLISFVYFASMLSQVINPLPPKSSTNRFNKSLKREQRDVNSYVDLENGDD